MVRMMIIVRMIMMIITMVIMVIFVVADQTNDHCLGDKDEEYLWL